MFIGGKGNVLCILQFILQFIYTNWNELDGIVGYKISRSRFLQEGNRIEGMG